MDPEARRRACVEFRVKLSRDTGVNLTAAACAELLEKTLTLNDSGEQAQITLQSNPGLFYAGLGEAIVDQRIAFVVPNHLKVAWWCYREAAEVHQHPGGMHKLAYCYYGGRGVTEDPAQAVAWFQKASDLGDAASKAALGTSLLSGHARAGVAKDAARGLALVREALELGYSPALYSVARCYLEGVGVEKDAAHGVALLREVITQGDSSTAFAQSSLAICYQTGNGVEADTVQAAWCQRGAKGGNPEAIQNLPIIRKCDFCGSTPARQLCDRCEKVRYCGRQCQLAHWNRETDTHKGQCRRLVPRRAAETSEEVTAPGAGTS
jgi:TPR repeat protein